MYSLYLIPVPLTDHANANYIISYPMLNSIRFFIVESVREARRNLRRIGFTSSFDECTFYEWNKHNKSDNDISSWIHHCKDADVALLSDAGCPAVADPGAEVVAMAHQSGIPVVPLIGPSSILLSLMGSGLNGQSFAFNGYLPVDSLKRKEKIKQYEQHSLLHRQTQIFIETPYRNQAVISDLLSILHPSTKLCIAAGLTSDQQYIYTDLVSEWKSKRFTLDKVPAVLLFLRE